MSEVAEKVEIEEVAEDVTTEEPEAEQLEEPGSAEEISEDQAEEGQPEEPEDEELPDEETPKTYTQAEIDAIVKGRIAKKQLEIEQARREAQEAQARAAEFEEFAKSQYQKQTELADRLGDDDFADDSLREMAKPADMPKFQQTSRIRTLEPVTNPEMAALEIQRADISMMQHNPEKYNFAANTINFAVQSGELPTDVINLSARHPRGAEFLFAVAKDESLKMELALASYNSATPQSFALKFNELADKLNVNSSANKPQKKKPAPNTPVKSKPTVDKVDDETVYID